MSSDEGQQSTNNHSDEDTSTDVDNAAEIIPSSDQSNNCVKRVAATKALHKMKEWISTLCGPPENVEN